MCRVYGTPSYWVQKLFSEQQGRRYVATAVNATRAAPSESSTDVAASLTCQDENCLAITLKV
jgi:hypothetical protein